MSIELFQPDELFNRSTMNSRLEQANNGMEQIRKGHEFSPELINIYHLENGPKIENENSFTIDVGEELSKYIQLSIILSGASEQGCAGIIDLTIGDLRDYFYVSQNSVTYEKYPLYALFKQISPAFCWKLSYSKADSSDGRNEASHNLPDNMWSGSKIVISDITNHGLARGIVSGWTLDVWGRK